MRANHSRDADKDSKNQKKENPQNVWAEGMASVAIAGNNLAPVTTTVFMGSWYPLAQAYFDPVHLGSELQVDSFVGREWLISEIDRYISGNESGYFIIEAGAGLGKTAFAWQLATRGSHACHFTCIDPRARRTDEAVRNITAQLIAAWDLQDLAPQGMLPPGSDRPIWLRQVLAAVGVKRDAVNPTKPVVIVVDGLDEAERSPEEMPLGLPNALPKGVFVVATTRSGTALPALRRPYHVYLLSADDTNNRRDMDRYLSSVSKQSYIVDRLRGSSISLQDSMRVLSDRCAGVWVYLNYILSEIRYGQRQLDQIESIPTDLESYYTQNLSAMRNESDWSTWYLPLLSTLCAVTDPLEAVEISRLGNVADVTRISRFLLTRFRPFCQITSSGDHQLFRLYHSSLREYLTGTMQTPTLSAAQDLRHELRNASIVAHSQIVEMLLSEWGGLAHSLPNLQARLSSGENFTKYGLRNLVRHLECAKRCDEIDQLLNCEADGRNLWFEAHESQGDTDGYLVDIERACRLSVLENHRLITPIETATNPVRYALMAASVASRTAQIPLGLIEVLARTGAWTQAQCLEHVRLIYDRGLRAKGYVRILPYLTGPRRRVGQREALATTRAIKNNQDRAEVLVDIAGLVPSHQQGPVLVEAWRSATTGENILSWIFSRWSGEDRYRARAIALMADRFPEASLPDVLKLVLGFSDESLVRALTALTPRLNSSDIAQALSAIQDLPDESDRSECLIAFSSVMTDMSLIAQAINIAKELSEPAHRAPTLAALARRLPVNDRDETQGAAIESARSLSSPSVRAMSLIRVSSTIDSNTIRRTLEYDALSAAAEITDLRVRIGVLVAGCQYLGGNEWTTAAEEALQEVRELNDPDLEVSAICVVAPYIKKPTGAAAAKRALTIVTPIRDHKPQVDALAALVRFCSKARYADVWRLIRQIDDEATLATLLAELVQDMPQEFIAEVLTIASNCPDELSRLQLISVLAPRVPPELSGRLLELVQEPKPTPQEAELLRRLRSSSGRVPSRRQRVFPSSSELDHQDLLESYLLSRSLDHELISDPNNRFFWDEHSGMLDHMERQMLGRRQVLDTARLKVLQAAAPHLDDSSSAKALLIVRNMVSAEARTEAFAALYSNSFVASRKEIVQEIIYSLGLISNLQDYARLVCALRRAGCTDIDENATVGLTERFLASNAESKSAFIEEMRYSQDSLPLEFPDYAWSLLARVEDAEVRARSMLAIFPLIDDNRRDEAVQEIIKAASAINLSESRASAQTELLAYVTGKVRADTLANTLVVARNIQNECSRVVAVARLLEYLERDQRAEVVYEMVSIASTIYDHEYRCRALISLAPHLSTDMRVRILNDAVAAAESSSSDRLRSDLFIELAQVMGCVNFEKALAAIRHFTDDEYRSKTLQAFVEYLPEECLDGALEAALAIGNEDWRTQALMAIVQRLPLLQMLTMLKMTCDLHDSANRVSLLKACFIALQDYRMDDTLEKDFFQDWTRGLDRAGVLSVIAVADWWIAQIGGGPAAIRIAQSISEVSRWWP